MDYARLEQLLSVHGVTVYQVSKATGIAPSTFSDWKSGRSVPKANKLARIADYFGIGLDELLGTDSGARDTAAHLQSLRASRMVPVVGEILAGKPIVTSETLLGREFADVEEPENYFYLEAHDSSMQGCGIVAGTRVLFHRQQDAAAGAVVACLTEHGTVMRRLEKQGRRILLMPENAGDAPILLTAEDFEAGRARILGAAVEAKTKF